MLSSSVLLDSTQVKFLVSITDFLCFFFKEIKEYVLQLSRIISIILLIFSYQTPVYNATEQDILLRVLLTLRKYALLDSCLKSIISLVKKVSNRE